MPAHDELSDRARDAEARLAAALARVAELERHALQNDCQHQDPKRFGARPGDLALVCACGAEVFPGPRPTACPPSCADGHMYDGDCLIDPLHGPGAIGRSSFPGETGWYFSCDDSGGCEGLVSHGHTSDAAARRALDRHVKREHAAGVQP